MENQSVWLGRLRAPVRMGMIGFTILTLIIFAVLIVGQFVSAEPIGMYEMIRPAGRPLAQAMLFSLSGALLFASLFLSDTVGAIETRPSGFFDYISLVASRLAMVSITFCVIVMFYEVISRYAFNRPTLWANELSLWIASFIFLLAGLYAMQQRSHIRIYVIYDMFPRWMQKVADVISVALIVGFTFALVWGGFADAWTRMMRMETFGTAWDPAIPGTVKPAILIIIVLVTIQAVSNLIADWNKAPEHHGHDDIDEHEIETLRRSLEDK
ncbi:TRAP transporter small permease [Donghicola sp. C2-DW-16]|uniref:TRAP transporter small permease protein n=1 Tax=Donghicola mangrovi TaxID=2729614 RepID=A0A850Q287_9RHOB|nr:TRAP transporter small permease [Donghicola mangrovi]NVO23206.1 TRAP transporter small permease [Donghicola mangrovi]NVO28586.1 TRAP transporter small permease [Donghicola mangrovi]